MSLTTATPSQTTAEDGSATGISSLHMDILESHILTRLDGQSLASVSCASTALHSLSAQDNHHLWSNICHSTWPSTSGERVTEIISTSSSDKKNENGPRSFFSQSFPLPTPDPTTSTQNSHRPSPSPSLSSQPPPELISAVDVYYRNKLIFTKIEETETVSGWFMCSPFRIDLLDPKDVVPTQIPHPDGEDACKALMDEMTLSWILIDPVSRRAVNLSSYKPVSVQRHWLSGEVQVRFACILAGDQKLSPAAAAMVQYGIVVNCGGSEGGEMQVREVSLEVEDMDGKHLNGKDSLVILQKAMEGKRGSGVKREEEARKRYRKFEEMKNERKERKLKIEGTLDTLSVAFGLTLFASLFFIFW